ncbi:MAG TPA: hypothetical protein VHU14_08640 [Solirubrobacterales bacterium]|jgi:hypothetical protein|nr:hypothetical protein [Solirubrobacterales bacterium]
MSIYQRDPAAPGANVGRRRVADESPRAQAIARFNASDAGHTAAGLTRILGQPRVSVGAAAGSPNEVRITVAWELCWYQWGVDLGDPRRPVFEIARGTEVDELDRSARQWNGQASWLRLKRR